MPVTNLNTEILGTKIIDALGYQLAALNAFSTDFSPEAQSDRGGKVKVAVIGKATAYDVTGDYVVSEANLAGIDTELAFHTATTIKYTDAQLSKMAQVQLDTTAGAEANEIAKKVLTNVFTKVTPANYTQSQSIVAASFGVDNVIALGEKADDLGWSPFGRALVVSNALYSKLLASAKDASFLGSASAVQDGVLPNIAGFTVYKSSVLPTGTLGFIANPSAGAFASRYLSPGAGNNLSYVGSFSHEQTGLTIGIKEGYDMLKGQIRIAEILYGFEPAQKDALVRLVAGT